MVAATGVAHHSVPIGGVVRSNVSLTEADGTTTKVNEPGPSLSSDEVANLVHVALESCVPGGWFVVCGSLPDGFSDRALLDAVRSVQAAGLRVAVDTSGSALGAVVAAGPDLLKPNAYELAEVTSRDIRTIGDVVAAANKLRTHGVDSVLVSLGVDGAVLVDGSGALHGHAPVTNIVNTAGAGDAFLAGYLAADVSGVTTSSDRLASALRWGATAVQHNGTLFSDLDNRVVVHVAAAEPSLALSEPAAPLRAP
jgi:1-phosphofructokinase